MKLFSLWSKNQNKDVVHEDADIDIRSSWKLWDKHWREAMMSQDPYSNFMSYKYTRDISRYVVSKYFSAPNDVPPCLQDFTNKYFERDIILWAIKENKDDVLAKSSDISYPVLDIVKSILRYPDDWDIICTYETGCAHVHYIYKDVCLFSGGDTHSVAFTPLEKDIIKWCMEEIKNICEQRDKNKKREEFNNKWKELNYG